MRVKADIMVGDYFYATFRGEVQERKDIVKGKVADVVRMKDVEEAVLTRYPSLRKKDYRIVLL